MVRHNKKRHFYDRSTGSAAGLPSGLWKRMRAGRNCYHVAAARSSCAQLRNPGRGESRCQGLGEHKLGCVSLSGYTMVREYKAGRIHDAKEGPGGWQPSRVWQGLLVGWPGNAEAAVTRSHVGTHAGSINSHQGRPLPQPAHEQQVRSSQALNEELYPIQVNNLSAAMDVRYRQAVESVRNSFFIDA